MAEQATFLHLTDPHVSKAGEPHVRDDTKVTIPGIPAGTREEVLNQLFARLVEHIRKACIKLDAVIFSGDAQTRGKAGGHEYVFKLIIKHLRPFGISPGRIIAVPGNHDVPRGSEPSSRARYKDFTKVWRSAGCVVPWLDGVDPNPSSANFARHRLVAADGSWAIFPLNTSNWSNVTSVLPKPLGEVWDSIPKALAPTDETMAETIRSQLESLARYDMARVSDQQLEGLRAIMDSTRGPEHGRQLRIMVMHHHLRSPSLREELKPFADISNLEQVRAMLRGGGIEVVIHGHKHEKAAYYDHIYSDSEENAHRMLVISGATFDVGREQDAMRLVTVTGLPHVPTVKIEPLPLPRPGAAWHVGAAIIKRLWVQSAKRSDPVTVVQGAPIVVEGSDIDQVYARACEVASSDAQHGTLIIHLDLPQGLGKDLPFPATYPLPAAAEGDLREQWIRDLVAWWQLRRSQLEDRIPFVHGARLRRYGGKIDQIQRIIELLRVKSTTRAVAVLIDPFRDFGPKGTKEEFASFCLVEFLRRDLGEGRAAVDAIAFYRAQEFRRWWPINVAELRLLQVEIGSALKIDPGRITTIAADARTIAQSPTQVAMPIIDRWLDQAPERLHLLADALVYRSMRGEEQQRVISEWRHALVELFSAADEYNPDGVPIAIEGLRVLVAYLKVASEQGDNQTASIAAQLIALADHNESYERSNRELSDFKRWAPSAKRHVKSLEGLTAVVVGPSSPAIEFRQPRRIASRRVHKRKT